MMDDDEVELVTYSKTLTMPQSHRQFRISGMDDLALAAARRRLTWGPASTRLKVKVCIGRFKKEDRAEEWNNPTFGGISGRFGMRYPTVTEKAELNSFAHVRPSAQCTYVVAFVNSRSGGQVGSLILHTLHQALGEGDSKPLHGRVCDLSAPKEPTLTIEQIARDLDEASHRMRLLVFGGDGTVTWILNALENCSSLQGRLQSLPVGIVPLGTGNDLARSLGWGGKLRCVSFVLRYLRWAIDAVPVSLDQWRIVLRPHAKLAETHKLRKPGSHPQLVQDANLASQLRHDLDEVLPAHSAQCDEIYVGFWQNYFSLGIDAKVAAHVDRARGERCGQRCFQRGFGKACYAWQALRHGFGNRYITSSLQHMQVVGQEADDENGELDLNMFHELETPLARHKVFGGTGKLRQLMFLNINSYAAGLQVLPSEEQTAYKPSPSDGVFEVVGVRGLVDGLAMLVGVRPSYLFSAGGIAFSTTSAQYMQMDGEPWMLETGCDVMVEPHTKVTMLLAPGMIDMGSIDAGSNFWTEVH